MWKRVCMQTSIQGSQQHDLQHWVVYGNIFELYGNISELCVTSMIKTGIDEIQ